MSDSPTVALVRAIFAAWERGDWSSAEWADPNVEFEQRPALTGGRRIAVANFAEEVRARQFPTDARCYTIETGERERFLASLESDV